MKKCDSFVRSFVCGDSELMLFTRRRMFVSLVVCLLVVQVCWFVFVPSTSVSSMKERLIPSRFVLREDHSENESLPWCDDVVRRSLQRKKSFSLNVSRRVRSFADLEKRWSSLVSFGGYSSPSDCRQRDSSSLALIVCYREREETSEIISRSFPRVSSRSTSSLSIVRGQSTRSRRFQSWISLQHRICSSLEDLSVHLFHLSRCRSLSRRSTQSLFVFVVIVVAASTSFRRDRQVQIQTLVSDSLRWRHGLSSRRLPSNEWLREYLLGWGNEDDDMFLRVKQRLNQSTIGRYPLEIGRYQMIQQFGHRTSRRNPHRDRILHSRYSFQLDGLNNLRYRLHQLTFYPLFTLINVSLFQQSFEQISTTFNFTR